MSELDRIASEHARTVHHALAHREPPSLDLPLERSVRPQRGWLLALASAVAVAIIAIPLLPLTMPTGGSTTTPSSLGTEANDIDGWHFEVTDFETRDGWASAVSAHHLFVWGGADDSGTAKADGILIGLDQESITSRVSEAPIGARQYAVSVWTGDEFVVFGGSSALGAYADGAAYDPSEGVWTMIPPAPMSPGAYPAAVWTGTEMIVWSAGGAPGGQVAAYDPATGEWESLGSPPVDVSDATLLWDGDLVRLVGGPAMRDLDAEFGDARLVAVDFDPDSRLWGQATIASSPVTGSARAAVGPGRSITVLTSPSIYLVDEDNLWEAVGPAHHCRDHLDAASGGGNVYIRGYLDWDDPNAASAGGCTTFLFAGSMESMQRVVAWDDFGPTSNSPAALMAATDDGRLVAFGDPEPTGSGATVLGVYDPDGR